MIQYDLAKILEGVIRSNSSSESYSWLEKAGVAVRANSSSINLYFAAVPRKTGKSSLAISPEEILNIQAVFPGFQPEGWTIDRLCRVYLLLNLNPADKESYFRIIENLFLAAEMNELVALYSSLPVLAYPELWKRRCAEGIRSNIGIVLESIMYHNIYPAGHLDEPSWNQMVLKAFFTDKRVELIAGLDERANKELAYILSDYAHERWAANRTVNPQLWRLVGKFTDEKLVKDLEKVFNEGELIEKKAAALAVSQSDFSPAKELLSQHPDLKSAIENNKLTWDNLAVAA